jgi:hypothetical protein
MGLSVKELAGLWLLVIAAGLLIGGAAMLSPAAAMFVGGSIACLVGVTLLYAAMVDERRAALAKAELEKVPAHLRPAA